MCFGQETHLSACCKWVVHFTFEEKRKGRRINSIIFKIYRNENPKLALKENRKTSQLFNDEKLAAVIIYLEKNNIGRRKAQMIAQKEFLIIKDEKTRIIAQQRSPSFMAYVEEKVALLAFEQKKQEVKNPQGFLVKALEEDYINQDYINQRKRKMQIERDRQRELLKKKKNKELQQLKTKSYNLDKKSMKNLLSIMDSALFFEKMETFNLNTRFPVKLDKSKSPLANYEQQERAGKSSILRKIKEDFKYAFKSEKSEHLEKQIKQIERALHYTNFKADKT